MFKVEYHPMSPFVKFVAVSLIGLLGVSCASGSVPDARTPKTSGEPALSRRIKGHPCESPIESPGKVWERIQTVRSLPADERFAKCGLDFVEIISPWRSVPVDLLEPIVVNADEDDLVEWVRQRAEINDKAAAQVVAMDVIHGWRPGADPAFIRDNAERWRQAGVCRGPYSHLGNVFEEAGALPEILTRVTQVHYLRCLLEVNPLGFAVNCHPIHTQGVSVEVTWTTTTRDGLLEDIALKECKGRICKKLERTACELKGEYQNLMSQVGNLKVGVFREEIERWLVLPPFSDTSGA